MTFNPTGHFTHIDGDLYLLHDRLFEAPLQEVWSSVTSPTELAAWIGTYTGRPASGGVRFRMGFEGEDAPWQYVSILECVEPRRILLDIGQASSALRVFIHLNHQRGLTTLTLGQLMHSTADAAIYGPGWDYYLDRLVATRLKKPLPTWDSYHPKYVGHYEQLVTPAQ